MADTKISALTNGNPAQSGDEIPIARSGANYKITAGSIASLAAPAGSSGQLQYNNSGAFGGTSGITTTGTELTIASGTKTASTPVVDATQTWNSSGVTFTGIKMNVTDTASASGSLLADLQVGGTSKFSVNKSGLVVGQQMTSVGQLWSQSYFLLGSGADVYLYRDAANTLAQRNATNAQTLRVYNTYTSATNYERAKIAWDTNVLQIGTEKGSGGGTARALELQTDAATRLTIGASGGVTIADANDVAVGTTTGTKIGTATSQKLGFWNATPIVQPTTAVAAATVAATGIGDVVAASTTFDGYTIPQIVKALRNAGLLA